MTTRTLNGLTFHVHSPSRLELTSIRNDVEADACVTVEYGNDRWWIVYEDRATSHRVTRAFPSRDAAIALIAST